MLAQPGNSSDSKFNQTTALGYTSSRCDSCASIPVLMTGTLPYAPCFLDLHGRVPGKAFIFPLASVPRLHRVMYFRYVDLRKNHDEMYHLLSLIIEQRYHHRGYYHPCFNHNYTPNRNGKHKPTTEQQPQVLATVIPSRSFRLGTALPSEPFAPSTSTLHPVL